MSPYFLLSFIPAVGYWILETYSTLEIALIGGIALGIVEMIVEKSFTGHVHTLSKLNVALVVFLGAVSLLAREGIWFKLQPTFTGLAMAGFLLYQKYRGRSLMFSMLKEMKQKTPLPEDVYKKVEWHLCIFLLLFAAFMAQVAVYESTSRWLFWKTGGFYIVFGGFAVGEVFYLRRYLRRFKK